MSARSERWLVLSPHCDDAVLSLGAAIASHARRGGQVTVVTALAGATSSTSAASSWDAQSGFATEGDAAAARRVEDASACRIVGARPVHLDGVDDGYATEDEGPAVWRALHDLAREHDVVWVPGAPLAHPDHRRLALRALVELGDAAELRFYGEQPYLLTGHIQPGAALEGRPDAQWSRLHTSLWD